MTPEHRALDPFGSGRHIIRASQNDPSDNVNDDVHVDAQPSNNNDVEIEPDVDLDNPQSENQRYDKRDFIKMKTMGSETHSLSS